MKVNISDLLDDYREDTLITEESTPLSMERIRRRTMSAVIPERPRRFRRMVPVILAAALAVSVLAVTALAGGRPLLVSDWFRTALNQKAKEDAEFARKWDVEGDWKKTIGEQQLAVINDHGRIVNQQITDGEAAITLTALYGDEYVLNLYFQVVAPEGTILPDGLKYFFANGVHLTQSGAPQGVVLVPEGYALSGNDRPVLKAMPDADPEDNRKDFLLSLHHRQSPRHIDGVLQKPWTFSDDVPKSFAVEGLYCERERDVFEAIFLGSFSFDITNAHPVERREIDVSGSAYSGHTDWGDGISGYDYTIEPVRLSLSPFSAEMEYLLTCTDADRLVEMDLQVVLKDGTAEGTWQRISSRRENGCCRSVMGFTNPIDLDQIDYLLLGNPDSGEFLQKISAGYAADG